MRCLLFGHEYRRFPGQGDFDGQQFDICIHCCRTKGTGSIAAESEPHMPPREDTGDYPAVSPQRNMS